ncbi:MAG: hypothetical protein H7Y00_09680 [Fimbriimonadaceae bacterium]|nr:hypothetical protein [Chitinophagales bacterium]
MKKYILILLATPFVFAGCNQKKVDELEGRVSSLQSQSAEYQKGFEDAQNEISTYLSDFNEIETNLEEIKKQEGIISNQLEGENKPAAKQSIMSSIATLNELLQQNKTLVAELDKKYKNSSYKNKELDKMVAALNEKITEKETELLALKTELEQSHFQVTTLTGELTTVSQAKMQLDSVTMEQATTIAEQTEDLNTVYYISGSYKELKEKGVVDKEGGFIGLGATKELADDFNANAFTKVDLRTFTEIPVNSKNAKIVTVHPTGAYQLVEEDKEIEEIVISDPDNFWKSSKYLVVLTD